MGKVSPKNSKHKKRLRGSSNKYLKPGTLAQLRYSKASTTRSCTDIGKKRVAVLEAEKSESNLVIEDKVIDKSPLVLSPVNLVRQNSFLGTPKTPRVEDCPSESRLESLPMDLLVFFICLTLSFLSCLIVNIFCLSYTMIVSNFLLLLVLCMVIICKWSSLMLIY